MSKQAIMTAFKECLRCVNRTPGELERAIKTFTDTVDTVVDSRLLPVDEIPPHDETEHF